MLTIMKSVSREGEILLQDLRRDHAIFLSIDHLPLLRGLTAWRDGESTVLPEWGRYDATIIIFDAVKQHYFLAQGACHLRLSTAEWQQLLQSAYGEKTTPTP